jgi:hypothetical protein
MSSSDLVSSIKSLASKSSVLATIFAVQSAPLMTDSCEASADDMSLLLAMSAARISKSPKSPRCASKSACFLSRKEGLNNSIISNSVKHAPSCPTKDQLDHPAQCAVSMIDCNSARPTVKPSSAGKEDMDLTKSLSCWSQARSSDDQPRVADFHEQTLCTMPHGEPQSEPPAAAEAAAAAETAGISNETAAIRPRTLCSVGTSAEPLDESTSKRSAAALPPSVVRPPKLRRIAPTAKPQR